jgi:hypothetical protein
MIKGKGNNMGMAKDMGVINQGREKCSKNNVKHKNEQVQKKTQQRDHFDTCPQMKG